MAFCASVFRAGQFPASASIESRSAKAFDRSAPLVMVVKSCKVLAAASSWPSMWRIRAAEESICEACLSFGKRL